jgi:hypothetical protein
MGVYKFKICEKEDLPRLLTFIDTYWKKNHILVRSKEILDFQYYNRETEKYDFVLAENTQTGELDGIRGWIRVAQFDPALAQYDEVWSAVSKVRTDVENNEIKVLGSYLWRYLEKHKGFGTVGISRFSFAMHTAIRHKTCSLGQYFILNSDTKDFKIAVVPSNYQNPDVVRESGWHLREIADINTITEDAVPAYYRPFKSKTYLINRFAKHPVYHYHFYGIYEGAELRSILVGKFVEINDSKILRIVDVLGSLEEVGCLYEDFQDILKKTGSEYVDFLCFGIDDAVFQRMGFDKLDPEQEQLIIPNYFEPFEAKNIVINGAYKPVERYCMFKADADQDRPS